MKATNHYASIWVWLMGILWWLEETAYFGWNACPHSVAELFCDGSVILIYTLAALTYVLEKRAAENVIIIVEKRHD